MGSRLELYFRPSEASSALPRKYTDLEIQQIASILEEGEEESWSKVPRTYIVLRIIGRLDLMNDLLHFGFTDFCFPVQARSLPPSLPSSTRNAFVEAQPAVLTKSVNLEKENGRHGHFAKGEPVPFKILGKLGSGAYSQVHQIRSNIGFKDYALKRIRRRIAFGNDAREGLKQFISEMEIIKSLRHRHMVEFVGSYTDPDYLALVMSPVAEMNLAQLLDKSCRAGLKHAESEALRSFLGCLASALEYLHSCSIRHRDIKPQNILIENGNILFTDFGLSKNYSGDIDSITSGLTVKTHKYCAPEVADGSSRNSSSDVWSLGCVFLEMVSVLNGINIPSMKAFFQENGTEESSFHRNPEAITLFIREISRSAMDNKAVDITSRMLAFERTSRPTASEIFSFLTTPRTEDEFATKYCGLCCLNEYASDSHDSLCEEDPSEHSCLNAQPDSVPVFSIAESPTDEEERLSDRKAYPRDGLRLASFSSNDTTAVSASAEDLNAPARAEDFSAASRPQAPERRAASAAAIQSSLSPTVPAKSLTSRVSDDKPPCVFGVSVRESIAYAYSEIALYDGFGKAYLHGRVPIIVAKCVERLQENDVIWEKIIYERPVLEADKPSYLETLQKTFDDAKGYGKQYRTHGGGTSYWFGGLLLLYMEQLPEPIIPSDFYEAFRGPLRDRQPSKFPFAVSTLSGSDATSVVDIYATLIMELPSWSKMVLLSVLQLAALASKRNGLYSLPKVGFVATFQPWILSLPNHRSNHKESRLSHAVIEFLIENMEKLIQGLQGSRGAEETIHDQFEIGQDGYMGWCRY